MSSGVRLFPGAALAVSRPVDGEVRCVAIAEAQMPERASRPGATSFSLLPVVAGDYIHGAALLDCRVVDVADVLEEGGQFAAGKRNLAPAGYRAMTVVADGARRIVIGRHPPSFAPRAGLLADTQLAIASDLRRPGRDRDRERAPVQRSAGARDLSKSLERQKASAEILRVISGSSSARSPIRP